MAQQEQQDHYAAILNADPHFHHLKPDSQQEVIELTKAVTEIALTVGVPNDKRDHFAGRVGHAITAHTISTAIAGIGKGAERFRAIVNKRVSEALRDRERKQRE